MKKALKLLSFLSIVLFAAFAPAAMSSASQSDIEQPFYCKLFPFACTVSPMGAGGTDHGGPRPKPDPDKVDQ